MFCPLFDEVDLCVPVFEGPPPEGESSVCLTNLTVRPLIPYYHSYEIQALAKPYPLMRGLWPYIKNSDFVLINIPNYLGILAWLVCLLQRKRFALRLAGNWAQVIRLAFYNHKMKVLGDISYWLHHLLVTVMIKTSNATLAHGQELAELYGSKNSQVVRIISSTIHDTDVASCIAESGKEECQFLYVGRFELSKGLFELLHAAKALKDENMNFLIRMAGDGPRLDYFKNIGNELGINDRIEYLGWVGYEGLKEIYRTSDAFVFPSYSETGPKVVIESMANGLPVIVTKVGSVPVVMEDQKTGFIIPVKDIPALKNALRKMILERDLRRAMAQSCLIRARQFTMESERDCVHNIFKKNNLFP
jgi:glycosyltransferase involved in cell wall biosynthesis